MMKAIFERRSIRKYTGEVIPRETIEKILSAGMAAPSASNERPWQFIVLDDRSLLNGIAKIHPYAQMLKEASHAVVVCGDMRCKKFEEDFWAQDCAAAAENMLLMVQELGLGAVWLGVYPVLERVAGIRELLDLPENIVPFAVISLGYPAEKKDAPDRFDEKRVHWNGWSGADQ
jgi:nitroreductase